MDILIKLLGFIIVMFMLTVFYYLINVGLPFFIVLLLALCPLGPCLLCGMVLMIAGEEFYYVG